MQRTFFLASNQIWLSHKHLFCKYHLVAFNCCLITKFCFSHKHESYFSDTPTNSLVAYFFKSAKIIALVVTFSTLCSPPYVLSHQKTPTHHQKNLLRRSAPKKVKVCVEMQQLTLSLFSCAGGCCSLASGTITAEIMAAVAVARVDVGLLVLAPCAATMAIAHPFLRLRDRMTSTSKDGEVFAGRRALRGALTCASYRSKSPVT